jgi:hypothetical protein
MFSNSSINLSAAPIKKVSKRGITFQIMCYLHDKKMRVTYLNKRLRIPMGQLKIDNPKKLAT